MTTTDNDPWAHSATRTRGIDMARDHPAIAARLVANPEAPTQNAWDVLRSAFGRVEAQELVLQHDGGRQALERIGVELVCPHTVQGLPGRTIVSSHRLPTRQFNNPGWVVITKAPQKDATYPNEVYTTHLVVLGEAGFYAINGHYDLTADQAFEDFVQRCKKEI